MTKGWIFPAPHNCFDMRPEKRPWAIGWERACIFGSQPPCPRLRICVPRLCRLLQMAAWQDAWCPCVLSAKDTWTYNVWISAAGELMISPPRQKLAALMGKVKGKLNLIVYNSSPGSVFNAPSEEAVLAFEKILWNHNITAIRRKSKGADIAAACGQLRAKFSRQQ